MLYTAQLIGNSIHTKGDDRRGSDGVVMSAYPGLKLEDESVEEVFWLPKPWAQPGASAALATSLVCIPTFYRANFAFDPHVVMVRSAAVVVLRNKVRGASFCSGFNISTGGGTRLHVCGP